MITKLIISLITRFNYIYASYKQLNLVKPIKKKLDSRYDRRAEKLYSSPLILLDEDEEDDEDDDKWIHFGKEKDEEKDDEDEYPNMWDDWDDMDDEYYNYLFGGQGNFSSKYYKDVKEEEIKYTFDDVLLYRFYNTLLGFIKFKLEFKRKAEEDNVLPKDQEELIENILYYEENYPDNLFIPDEYVKDISKSNHIENFNMCVNDSIVDINNFKLLSSDNNNVIPEECIADMVNNVDSEKTLLVYSEESVENLKTTFDQYVDGETNTNENQEVLVLEKVESGYIVVTGW